MLEMNRRSFLKGLLALSGAAVLMQTPHLVEASLDKLLAEPWQIARPVGRLGTLRLGDQWYRLQGYDLTIVRTFNRMVSHPSDRGGGRNLVDSPWQLEFEVLDDPWGLPAGELDFEILAHPRLSFCGRGAVDVVGGCYFAYESGEPVSYHIDLNGLGRMTRQGEREV